MDASSSHMQALLREVEKQIPLQSGLIIDPKHSIEKQVAEKLSLAAIEEIASDELGVIVDIPASKPEPPAVALIVSLSQTTDIVIGLTVASVVYQFRDRLQQKVRVVFTSATDSPPEIARLLQWQGATIPVFIGFNVRATGLAGQVAIPMREIALASHDFALRISAEQPQPDLIQVAAQIVTNLNQILTRKTDPLISMRIVFSSIQSRLEDARSPAVEVEGKVYLREESGSGSIPSLLEQTISALCKAHCVDYQLDFKTAAHSLKVDGLMSKHLRESAIEILGKDKVFIMEYPGHEFDPLLEYFRQVPGGVMQIGATNDRDDSSVVIQAGVKALGWALLKKSLSQ